MKNFYVIKDDGFSKLYTKKEFNIVQEYIKENPHALLKGFYDIEYAERFLEKKPPIFFYIIKTPYSSNMYNSKYDFSIALSKLNCDKNDIITITTRDKGSAYRNLKCDYYELLEERDEIKRHKEEKKVKEEQKAERRKLARSYFKIKQDYIAFIDCEASHRKAISIGLVVYDTKNHKIVDKYYSLIRPKEFKELEYHVAKLTGLTTEMVLKAASMNEILPTIVAFLDKYNIKAIYSWGPDDKKYITSYLSEAKVGVFCEKINNIQKTISSATYEHFHNDSMSLSNMKEIYHLDTEKVTHNALDDAIDLANIFNAWYLEKDMDFNVKFSNGK